LLEILIALAILSVSMAVLLSSLSTSINHQLRAKRETEAAELAQSLLARLGTDIPLQIGEIEGDEGPNYHWHLSMAAYGETAGSQNNLPRALDTSVTVSWDGGVEGHSVTLRTLKLTPPSALPGTPPSAPPSTVP
jgi:general secretion pathway protein I